jgi:hypothetical protein
VSALDRFARNEIRLAAVARIPAKTRDRWALGVTLEPVGDDPSSLEWSLNLDAAVGHPKLGALFGKGLDALALPELAATPITRIEVWRQLGGAKGADIKKFLKRPELRRLRALSLRGAKVAASASELSGCTALESLDLVRTGLEAPSLVAATGLDALRSLDVGGNELSADDIAAVVQSPTLPALKRLAAAGNPVDGDGLRSIAARDGFSRLEGFSVTAPRNGRFSAEDWSRFASAPHVAGLRWLDVQGCGGELDAQGGQRSLAGLRDLRAMLGEDLRRIDLPALTSLALSLPSAESLRALLASPAPPGLRALDLTLGWYDLDELPALYRSPWCAGLERLVIRDGGFRRPDDAAHAFDLPKLQCLRELAVHGVLPTASLERLLARGALDGVERLFVGAIEPGGARAIATREALGGLKELGLRAGRSEPDELAALVTSPAAVSLQHLWWGSSALDVDAVRATCEGATCARLIELRITVQATVDRALVARLSESPRTPRLWALASNVTLQPSPTLRTTLDEVW